MRARAVSAGSCRPQADVAQLVEQLIRNQQVTGSSPVNGSSSHVPRRPEGRRFNTTGNSSITASLLSIAWLTYRVPLTTSAVGRSSAELLAEAV